MAVVNKVSETLYDQIKTELDHVSPLVVAQSNHLSMKTILMVKGSPTYKDYEEQKMAQHPKSNKKPIGDRLDELERLVKEMHTEIMHKNRLF